MDDLADRIDVSFAVPFAYPVIFTDGVFEPPNLTLLDALKPSAGRPRAVCFVDAALNALPPKISAYFAHHFERIDLVGEVVTVPGGENAKRGTTAFDLTVAALRSAKLDRHSYAIIVGGGAVLDAVGLAASVVHRGVRQVRVPSTVLGQNDAGIGVKNGIDFGGLKNGLGTFSPPHAVINDFTLLKTLSAAAWRDGVAEAIKVALIRDADFFGWLEQNVARLASRDEAAMRHMIRRCAELHLQQITTGGDPFERGSARPLDFGHWAAHKLEQLSDFALSHGSAVAAGVAIDTAYSAKVGLLNAADADRVRDSLLRSGFTLSLGAAAGLTPQSVDRLMAGVDEFQEHLGGTLCLTMLAGIGMGRELSQIDRALLAACCREVLW